MRRCWRPCWATASPASTRSSSQFASAGERAGNGCSCGAGITSSVTRSTPRSSSQSRISAQRSKVDGSTSWSATASAPCSAGHRASQLARFQVGELGGERALPAVRGGEARDLQPIGPGLAGALDRREQRVRIAGFEGVDERPEQPRGRGGRAGHGRRAARGGLERDETERLELAGHDDAAGAAVGGGERLAVALVRHDRARDRRGRACGSARRPRRSALPAPISRSGQGSAESAAASSSSKTPFSRLSRPA